jgi:hypothetical protein
MRKLVVHHAHMSEDRREPCSIQLALRIPESLVMRIDAFTRRVNDERPGLSASRSAAARMLIEQALALVEAAAETGG